MLVLLMENIRGVLISVNNSEARFKYVEVVRKFSEHEIGMLVNGLERVRVATNVLNERYETAARQLFARVLEKSNANNRLLSESGQPLRDATVEQEEKR